jgi:hypothetical protein
MIPAISICQEDGNYLAELARKGPVTVRLRADAFRGYKKVRLPSGTLTGVREPEKYVLFATHYCSWFIGATDNAVGNSLLLEMARIFSKHRKHLGRGIRFAWWPGHSQASFGGSTWYLDTFWEDVRDNAVAYLTMDGVGRMGSSGFESRNTEEIRRFHEMVIKDVLGLEVKSKRVSKSGDQSFWGMGLPSFTGNTTFTAEQTAAMEGNWYGHTEEDTLDKVDMELITIPFKVNAVSILRLCNNPILPFEFVTVAEAFKTRLNELQEGRKSVLDLTSLMTQVEALKENLETLDKAIEKNLFPHKEKRGDIATESKFKEINTSLMELSRILIPVLSSQAGKYGQDPMGSKFKPIPNLQPLEGMSSMDSNSEKYKALRTSLLRERNRLSDALNLANRVLAHTFVRI